MRRVTLCVAESVVAAPMLPIKATYAELRRATPAGLRARGLTFYIEMVCLVDTKCAVPIGTAQEADTQLSRFVPSVQVRLGTKDPPAPHSGGSSRQYGEESVSAAQRGVRSWLVLRQYETERSNGNLVFWEGTELSKALVPCGVIRMPVECTYNDMRRQIYRQLDSSDVPTPFYEFVWGAVSATPSAPRFVSMAVMDDEAQLRAALPGNAATDVVVIRELRERGKETGRVGCVVV